MRRLFSYGRTVIGCSKIFTSCVMHIYCCVDNKLIDWNGFIKIDTDYWNLARFWIRSVFSSKWRITFLLIYHFFQEFSNFKRITYGHCSCIQSWALYNELDFDEKLVISRSFRLLLYRRNTHSLYVKKSKFDKTEKKRTFWKLYRFSILL
jgi:hypothetical protein